MKKNLKDIKNEKNCRGKYECNDCPVLSCDNNSKWNNETKTNKSVSILNAFRNKYYTDGNNTENGVVANAIDDVLPEYIRLKEITKQIPQTPHYEGDGYSDGEIVYDTWICPSCEESFEIDYEKYDYCPCCGQRIDWSE